MRRSSNGVPRARRRWSDGGCRVHLHLLRADVRCGGRVRRVRHPPWTTGHEATAGRGEALAVDLDLTPRPAPRQAKSRKRRNWGAIAVLAAVIVAGGVIVTKFLGSAID